MSHPEMYRLRRSERELLAADRRRRRIVAPEVREQRALILAEAEASRTETARNDEIERQKPCGELAAILIRSLDADDMARALALLPKVNIGALIEAVQRVP